MKTETDKILDQLLEKDLYIVWEQVKSGELDHLDGLDRQLADIMAEHKDTYFEGFENTREESLEECSAEDGIDPYMHVIIHTVIEFQLKSGDISQIDQFYIARGRIRLGNKTYGMLQYYKISPWPILLHPI